MSRMSCLLSCWEVLNSIYGSNKVAKLTNTSLISDKMSKTYWLSVCVCVCVNNFLAIVDVVRRRILYDVVS